MKSWFYSLLILAATVSPIWAQTDLVKQDAELNSAKADLEEGRKARDMVVAQRWQDRKVQNEEREALTEKLAEMREKLDAAAVEKNRMFEDVRAAREEVARLKTEAETARMAFFALGDQTARVEPMEKILQQGAPFEIPERLQKLNALRQSLASQKDDPGRTAGKVLYAALDEMWKSRKVIREEAELVFGGKESVRGERVRMGFLGGVQYTQTAQKSALLLPQAGEKGRVFSWQSNLSPVLQQAIGKTFFAKSDSQVMLLPVDVLLSTTLSAQMAEQTEMGWQEQFWKWMKDGGYLMYAILGLGVLALVLMLERLIVLAIRGSYSSKVLRKVMKLAESGDVDAARLEAAKLRGAMGRVVQAIFRHPEGGRASAEKALEEVFVREVPALERRLGTISVLGASAPLLGLLGTVMGMIQLFEIITLYGTNDPKMLAGGIAIALITTEGGLIVAIPVQLLHSWTSNRVDNLVNKLESTSLQLLNHLWIKPQ